MTELRSWRDVAWAVSRGKRVLVAVGCWREARHAMREVALAGWGLRADHTRDVVRCATSGGEARMVTRDEEVAGQEFHHWHGPVTAEMRARVRL